MLGRFVVLAAAAVLSLPVVCSASEPDHHDVRHERIHKVPEPSTAVFLSSGLVAGAAALARRRRNK
jgi:PEP-CTERM motif